MFKAVSFSHFLPFRRQNDVIILVAFALLLAYACSLVLSRYLLCSEVRCVSVLQKCKLCHHEIHEAKDLGKNVEIV